jgi:CBS domain-containing protein
MNLERNKMKIENLMTPDVQYCHPQDTLESAAEKMWDYDIGCLPVVDDSHNAVGMITDRDICMAAYTQGRLLSELPVAIAMSKELYACMPNDSIKDAEEALRAHQVRRLPVLNRDRKLVGIVSLNDIIREAEREISFKTHDISTQEVTETLASVCQPRQHNGRNTA